MTKSHTPGPWLTKREGFSTVYVEARIGGGWIQEVAACGPTNSGQAEQEANARLIAAAPDLLQDLQAAAAQLRQYEALHRAKNTEDSLRKAEVNAELATRFEQTIAKATE